MIYQLLFSPFDEEAPTSKWGYMMTYSVSEKETRLADSTVANEQ